MEKLSPGSSASLTLPFVFETNKGQAPALVQYLARGPRFNVMLDSDGATLLFNIGTPDARADRRSPGHAADGRKSAEQRALQIRFLRGSQAARLQGERELPGKVNYLVGSRPEEWKTNVPLYEQVRYRGVYPGIDVVFYGAPRDLEYDFLISAGASPRRIALEYAGASRLSLDGEGNLVIDVAGTTVVQAAPHAYQDFASGRKVVESRYRIKSPREVRFELGPYDATKAVVIDPVLRLSTFLGGVDADRGLAITRDIGGKIYLVGETGSLNFPVTAGAHDVVCGADSTIPCRESFPPDYTPSIGSHLDGFVAKVDPSPPNVLYITYLGGDEEDRAIGVAVDERGSAYVTGSTRSVDFPGGGSTNDNCGPPGAPQERTYCPEGFLVKLSANGSGLVYSQTFGGGNFVAGHDVALDGNLNAYVAGRMDMRSFVNKFDPSGVILPLNSFRLNVSTAHGIAVDPAGSVYVVGEIFGPETATSGAFDTTCGNNGACDGTSDAFVAKLTSTLGNPVYLTYLGGGDADIAHDVAVNDAGVAFVTGATRSPNFPVDPSAWQPAIAGSLCSPGKYCFDAFVTSLNSQGSGILHSTYLGGSRDDEGRGIFFAGNSSSTCPPLVVSNRFYVAGTTSSTDLTVIDPVQGARGGSPTSLTSDAFIAEFHNFSRGFGCDLVSNFLTYFGGGADDRGSGIVLGGADIYLTGSTSSADFPTLNRFIPGVGDLAGAAFLVHLGDVLPAYTDGSFGFDAGTNQNWRLEGAFDENGGGPYVSNFVNGWSDAFDYPTWPGSSPTGDGEGSLRLFTPFGHGITTPGGAFWIMRFLSPDLSASLAWQSAAGFTVKIGGTIQSATPLYANLFVRVFDVDQARDRFFFNGTARALQENQWNAHSFQWSTISTFPVNHIVRDVFVNIWGERSTTDIRGELFMDEVQIITDLDGDRFGSDVDCNDNNPTVYPGAPQICDGLNNNCNDPSYPNVPAGETDSDGDGYSSCAGDCNDQDATAFPGNAEICDTVDNDCDGVTDNAPVPGQSPSLRMDPVSLQWSAVEGATGYDVVRGDVHLLAGGGALGLSVQECLANDTAGLSLPFSASPPDGAGWWFLVRAVNCGGGGTYGTPQRDASVSSSSLSCP